MKCKHGIIPDLCPTCAAEDELQRSATPGELRLERLIDAVNRLDERAAQIADAISDLENVIAGATVAIVAGMLYKEVWRPEAATLEVALNHARRIIEEVGNG